MSAAVSIDDVAELEWDWQTSTEPPPPDTPLELAAAYYARCGLAIVPLVAKDPSRFGDDWWVRAITDPVEALQVFSDSRFTNIGWAQGYGTVAIDVDHQENLSDELRAVVKRGARNDTRPGRGHRIFATDQQWGGSTSGFPCSGWGEVRAHGGQIVIWGPHPDSPGQRYCYDPRQVLPELPAELAGWLRPRGDYEGTATSEEVAAFLAEHTDSADPSALARAVDFGRGLVLEGESIHETTVKRIAPWVFRQVRAGLCSGEEAHAALEAWWAEAWEQLRPAMPADANGEVNRAKPNPRELLGIYRWAVARAVEASDAELEELRSKALAPTTLDDHVDTSSAQAGPVAGSDGATVLPDDLFEARQSLSHIGAAARSRMGPRDAVLGAVLARVAAHTPHTVKLPPTIGSPVGLTYYVAPVAPPGLGKTVSMSIARELVPTQPPVVEVPTGSGEGLIEVLFDMVDEPDPDTGKKTKVRRQVRHQVIVTVGEGAQLFEIGQRQGSTTLSTIRCAYTDDVLGTSNATAERRRIVPAGQAVYALVIGFQPELAGPLLEDHAAGTPQRFVWVTADDPGAPDEPPEWPGQLPWTPPTPFELRDRTATVGGYQRQLLSAPEAILEPLRSAHRDRLRRQSRAAPLDEHRGLVTLKTAALLALLDGRFDIDVEDWELAEVIVATSAGVRTWVQHQLRSVDAQRERAHRERIVGRDAALQDAADARALAAASRAVARKVHRRGGRCTRRELHHAIKSNDRRLVTVDDAIERAVADGFVVADGDGWAPGRTKP